MTATPWWQKATGYQIYPRSFADANGDGIGDIPGIISRLDHLADLGIGFIWLSPVYRSPMRDNGYDISDYREIAPEFGTMADMERLISAARDRGIGIVMDLVVNHTSDAHAWFQTALADPSSPQNDYYVWRDPAPDGGPPNDMMACFGGSSWNWVEARDQYYLGHFSPGQPDLNWQNPRLRSEIWDMMNWWLDKGIAGFRMDVISLIGKDPDRGIMEEGPDLHAFLQEMRRETLKDRDIVSIGESWSVSRETALLYCGRGRNELDMVFQFAHVKAGWDETFGKFRPKPFDLAQIKGTLFDWQATLADDGWNSLFLSNHDLPRHLSIYGDDGTYRVASAKAWATALHLMKGTPFVYQGEEIGMTNFPFTHIDQFRDLETLNHHADQIAQGVEPHAFLEGANRTARDHSRTPMQWDDGPQAGFTTGVPWIAVNPNKDYVNVASDRSDPDGVYEHYRRLIALRRADAVVSHGHFRPVLADHPELFAYTRDGERNRLVVLANLSSRPCRVDLPAAIQGVGEAVIHTAAPRAEIRPQEVLAPWEAFAVRLPV